MSRPDARWIASLEQFAYEPQYAEPHAHLNPPVRGMQDLMIESTAASPARLPARTRRADGIHGRASREPDMTNHAQASTAARNERRWPMPAYPRGWYVVSYSSDLGPERVIPLRYFGQDLVLYRAKNGAPVLLDAYCPHIGTHLGIGGTVDGDCIRCPMHGWLFDRTGTCTNVPYLDELPRNHRVRAWPVYEQSGLVWTYYDANQNNATAPTWDPPLIEAYDDPDWTAFDEGRRWVIRTHVQMFHENAVDVHHFRQLHRLGTFAEPTQSFDGAVMISRFMHLCTYPELGIDEGIEVETRTSTYGLGLTIGHTTTMGEIESLSLATSTPIDEEHIDARMATAVRSLGDEAATASLFETVVEATARHRRHPHLGKPELQHRGVLQE
ncbi:MAG: Vanillate O-demethylase oxygenase subunit protein [Frankiales bacterium]|nr:Vanillate O-demethylase oxygenase subunit protein [Frankiales bacterium]